MPLFAFFLMLAAAGAVETVTKRLWRIEYPEGTKFSNIQFSKTDKYIAARQDGWHCILDAETGAELFRLPLNHDCPEWGLVAFINQDSLVLVKSMDKKRIEAYDTKGAKLQYSFEAVEGDIIDFDVARYESKIIARVGINELKIWDLKTKMIIGSYILPKHVGEESSWLYQPHFTPDAQQIMVNAVHRYYYGPNPQNPSAAYGNIERTLILNLNFDSVGVMPGYSTYRWSPSGNLLSYIYDASEGSTSILKIIDWQTKKVIRDFEIPGYARANYFFTKDEQFFVVAFGTGGDICSVFRLSDGVNTINYQTGTAGGAALSNSGNEIAFVNDRVVFAYDFSSTSSVEKGDNNANISISPNPLSGIGIIKFNLEKTGIVNISISDELGNLVKTICNTEYEAGAQTAKFDVSNLANGAYFISVKCNNQTFTQQIIVNK